MEIRPARTDDAGDIVTVRALVRTDYYPNAEYGITADDVWLGQQERRDDEIEKLLGQLEDSENYHVDVLTTDEGDVVGYCFSSKADGNHRLDYIHILPEYQGSGYGGQMIDRTLEWLGDEEPITLEVVTYNERGLTIWENLGFVAIGTPPQEYSTTASGKVVPHHLMQRPAQTL